MTKEKPGFARSILVFLRDLVIIVLIAVTVSFLVRTFLVRTFWIPSASMQNTLQVNDRILVEQLTGKVFDINRGDVVVFQDPGGWLNTPPDSSEPSALESALQFLGLGDGDAANHLVKRVVGLPGDTVACCNGQGQLTINGVGIVEPYLVLPSGVIKASAIPFEVTVPKDSLWVLGDNRYDSGDSRYNQHQPGGGFVPIENVVGKAMFVYWPLDRISWLDNFPQNFSRVPEPVSSDDN